MDAYDKLLLSKGVFRRLGIVSYDPSVSRQSKDQSGDPIPLSRSVWVSLVSTVRLRRQWWRSRLNLRT